MNNLKKSSINPTNILSENIAANFQYLQSLIARKPRAYTTEWAGNISEAFFKYTKTNTINLLVSTNSIFGEYGWFLPCYIDLKKDFEKPNYIWDSNLPVKTRFLRTIRKPNIKSLGCLPLLFINSDKIQTQILFDRCMVKIFENHKRLYFEKLLANLILAKKQSILEEIKTSFNNKMWVSSITLTMGLLDFVCRSIFETQNLRVSIQTLHKAFIKAGLRPDDLNVLYGQKSQLSLTTGDDLRLIGVYLSSFFDFAEKYYAGFDSESKVPEVALNRHSIMHCSFDEWSKENAIRLLNFLDVLIELAPVIKIIVHGKPVNS